MQRLDDINAADSLAILLKLPYAHPHPLYGDRKGQYSIDVKQPYRLLFRITDDPIPRKEDGGVDIDKVTSVMILEVADTHG